jgi:hypothetical protein
VIETLWGDSTGWHRCTLFPTRRTVKNAYEHLGECGRPPWIERLYGLSDRRPRSGDYEGDSANERSWGTLG